MNTYNRFLLFLSFFCVPALLQAGESAKGTVIMISSVSGWLLLSSAVLLWKEIRKGSSSKHKDQ
ncbi:MAG: hypothetical protein CML13_00170 [Puniceicoccaceae bacterium]|nr:hypothetical protein [Puniceicoccaceae bacterium]